MRTIQPSFSAGELAPGLHGRVDQARYLTGLALCRNAVVKPSGGFVKRPGFCFRDEVKDSADYTRLLPFVYSTDQRYLVEAGDLYFRFQYLDPLTDEAFLLMDGATRVEIVTPYTSDDVENIRLTQSADVLYIVCDGHPPRELRRLSSVEFELVEYDNRNGPFRPVNTNAGVRCAVSAAIGSVVVTCTDPIFTVGHEGAQFFVEEPELKNIAPWEIAARGITVGTLKRSDGKVYRASALSSGGTYVVCGGVRPIHDEGRAWDGSKDVRSDGVANYSVGVEWEYVHGGFGVVKLLEFVDANTMNGLVMQRVPDSCVGTVAPATEWLLSGDGVTKTFALAPAPTSDSPNDYTVAIDGAGVPR